MRDRVMLACAVAAGAARFFVGPTDPPQLEDTYKDLAHVVTGVTVGGWVYANNKWCRTAACALIAVELFCFAFGKLFHVAVF